MAGKKVYDHYAPPNCKNCGESDSYEAVDSMLFVEPQASWITLTGPRLQARIRITYRCGSCGHIERRAILPD